MIPRNGAEIPASSAAAPGRTRRRARAALAAGLAAAVLGTTVATGAAAAPATTSTPVTLAGTHAEQPAAGAGQAKLGINMLTQDQDQWCWVAAGLTIAQFLGKGKDIDQNTFCDYAHNLQTGEQCPNQPGEFSDDQNAFSKLGMSTGQNVDTTLPFADMKAQIDAGKPIEVGILWAAGGGHANVLYGYDSDKNTMMYGDPWPSSARYGEMQYDQYVTNDQFHWAASLYGMG